MELVILKTLHDRKDTGVDCGEVVGIYGGSVMVHAYDVQLCKAQVKPWVTAYTKHINPNVEIGFKHVPCSDINCLFAYELFEVAPNNVFLPFETLHFMKHQDSPIKGTSNA